MAAEYELRVDPQQIAEVVFPSSLIPIGSQSGDVLAFRPVNYLKSKRDNPLLHKLDTTSGQPQSQRLGITVSPQVAASFDWIISGARTLVEVDFVSFSPALRCRPQADLSDGST